MVKRKFPESLLCCDFCKTSQKEVKKLIAGPTVYICDRCVERCVKLLGGTMPPASYEPVVTLAARADLQTGVLLSIAKGTDPDLLSRSFSLLLPALRAAVLQNDGPAAQIPHAAKLALCECAPNAIAHPRCDFCNKKRGDVKQFIAGPMVHICNECVEICVDIVMSDDGPTFDEEMITAAKKRGLTCGEVVDAVLARLPGIDAPLSAFYAELSAWFAPLIQQNLAEEQTTNGNRLAAAQNALEAARSTLKTAEREYTSLHAEQESIAARIRAITACTQVAAAS